MNGVEILNSVQVASELAFNWIWFWVGFGIIFGICMSIGIWCVATDMCEWQLIPSCLFLGIIFGSILGVTLGRGMSNPTSYETHYEVIIDDTVSMNEFMDRYEIVDQEGRIYTVREKE